jgi:hypothetical protein
VATTVDCLVEVGSKRVFASAVAWPGWCRPGRDEDAAMLALDAYRPRYVASLKAAGIPFGGVRGALRPAERTGGNATTDFGAPDGVYELDAESISAREWARLRGVLQACWMSFDRAATGAGGVELTKGPRGGGRELDAIVGHVVGAEVSYLRKLTGQGVAVDEDDPWGGREPERDAVLVGLDRAKAGDLPERGPRGGVMWTPRRFLRRAAWHVLDHAWEIEDRSSG